MTTEIRVLGPGCAKCQKVLENTREAVAALELDANVEKTTDAAELVARGILSTPALLVNDRVVIVGHVMSVPNLEKLLSEVG